MQAQKEKWPTMKALFPASGLSIKQYRRDMSMARDRILAGSRVIKTAQRHIEYSTFGHGFPVLFVHGAGGGHDMGQMFAKRIGEDFFWICPSRFGYLRTPIPKDASFESQADTHAALLDFLHIEKVAIVGLSAGGPSALLFALRHPDRCTALVLQSAISKTTPKRSKADWFYNILFSSDFLYWVVSVTWKNLLFKKFGVNPSVLTSLTQDEKRSAQETLSIFHPASQRLPGILNDQKATISDKQYDLDKIGVPTLILHAVDDCLVDFDFAQYAHALIPHSELVPFPSGGHMLLGQHERYQTVIANFLKELMKRGSGSTL